jgi:alkane 1-monooxygenase
MRVPPLRDRLPALGFALPLLLTATLPAGRAIGGTGAFLTVAVAFGLLPLLDHLVGAYEGRSAPATSAYARTWFDGLLYAWVPLQFAVLAYGAAAFADAATPLEALGIALSTGTLTGGIGIVVAHELGHRLRPLDRALSWALLASTAYAHFQIEHNQGHHARVATPEDPATARAGESLYAFVPRSVVGGFASAAALEAARLRRAGRSVASPHNRMLWAVGSAAAIAAPFGVAFGARGLAFWLLQAVFAVALLEAVNYVEHYGLLRTRTVDGRYERVRPEHSWNSSHRVSNWLLFNLQRHSHHHSQVTVRYEALEHRGDAPQLPTGYPGAILLALVPPLWRHVMDARLQQWRVPKCSSATARSAR